MKKNILFVGHDANRAGAQLLLLFWQQLLINSKDFTFTTLLKKGGVLVSEYEKLGKVIFWNNNQNHSDKNRFKRAFDIIFPKPPFFETIEKLKSNNFDIIISNTLVNGDVLPYLSQLKIPIISYVHELEMHLDMYTTKIDLTKTLEFSKYFFVCANIAGQNLTVNHGINPGSIAWIPTPSQQINIANLKSKSEILDSLNFGNNNKLVGCIGSVNLRKGIDFFVQLATLLPDLNFIWIGGSRLEFMEVINFSEFPTNLRFIPNTNEVLSYLNCFDIYAQTSRVEVFPLSVMEAFELKKPVVCFQEAGGTKEIVESDAGFVIAQLNIFEMAAKVKQLSIDEELALKMGLAGYNKVNSKYAAANSLTIFKEQVLSVLNL